MGIWDKNIHMNGAGTTYQAFLDLAAAAEEKGGNIGDRTVRLVKDGDGLATTTFHGSKGARVDQIGEARNAFLNAIAREFGYAARSIAEKTLGNGAGQQPVPLTARAIHAVNQALGDKAALAAESEIIRTNKADFEIEVVNIRAQLAARMGATDAEFDRERIQAEVLKLIGEGKFANNKDGMRAAVREVAAERVAVAVRLESLLRNGAPEHLVRKLAETVLDEAVSIIEDRSVPDGDGVSRKLSALAARCIENGQDIFKRDAIAQVTVSDAEKLITDAFGVDAFQNEDASKALESLKSKLDKLKGKNLPLDKFMAECDIVFKETAKAYVVRQIGMEMMMAQSDNPSYGRLGVRLYDALGVGNGENDRAIDDFYFWKMEPHNIHTRFGLDAQNPEELRRLAARIAFGSIAEDYTKKLPPLPDQHPHLPTARISAAYKVAAEFGDRFAEAVTDDDIKKLADDFKAQLNRQLDRVNTTLKNIDVAANQTKGELEGQLEQLAGKYGFPLTQGIRGMLSRILEDATDKLKADAPAVDKALSAEECKAAILNRVEKKWLSLCRQAAAEIDASSLEPAQKKAFLAKVMEGKIDVTHVKMVLRTVPAIDAKGLVDAAKGGDGKKLAEQLFQFVFKANGMITDNDELQSIKGSDDYTAFVAVASDLLFIMNPEIGEGVRGLDADSRSKLFNDAIATSSDKSREIQNGKREGLDPLQEIAVAMEARHWSSATSCAMQLRQAIG